MDELEGNTRPGELAAGAFGGKLRVGDRHALRHEVRRLVMIRHGDVYAHGRERCNLIARGDAVVDRDDERRAARLHHALERDFAETVPLVEAMRDERMDRPAEFAERLGQKAGRCDAVDVEIAEHRDGLTGAERRLHAVGDV